MSNKNKKNWQKSAFEGLGIIFTVSCAALAICGGYYLQDYLKQKINPEYKGAASSNLDKLPMPLWLFFSTISLLTAPILGYQLGKYVYDEMQERGFFQSKANNGYDFDEEDDEIELQVLTHRA